MSGSVEQSNQTEGDREQQQEELESIEAIYGEDCEVNRQDNTVTVYIPNKNAVGKLILLVHIPSDYPSLSSPIFELEGLQLSESLVSWAVGEMEKQFQPGEPNLFVAIEWLREQEDLWAIPEHQNSQYNSFEEESNLLAMENQQQNQTEENGLSEIEQVALAMQDDELMLMNEIAPKIVHGEPNTERKSTFQAHCLHVRSVEEVEAMMKVLLQNNKIRHATHNIIAYRIYNPVTKAYIQDYDEDGEAAAGGRLLHMLQAAGVKDVVVVVSRWFGGVLLGPSRFAHINNTARQLLEQEGYIIKEENNKPKKGKK